MTITVKYGIEPVYEKNEKEKVKLLYGYIVSKCYKLEDYDKNIVLFPYVLDRRTYKLNSRRTPEQIVIGFNTTDVEEVFDSYIIAKIKCNTINKGINFGKDRYWKQSLQELEDLVNNNTKDMKIKEKKRINIKKPIR